MAVFREALFVLSTHKFKLFLPLVFENDLKEEHRSGKQKEKEII